MVPYFEQLALHLGPVSIHAFGVLVALALLLGLRLTMRRSRRQGLDAAITEGMIWYAAGFGVAGAHLYSGTVGRRSRGGDRSALAYRPGPAPG